jgi:exopolysaccharide biosynthesis polyprenyl glycosylphosphotransferase
VRFHALSWPDIAAISSRQILVISLLVFGLMAAIKDRTISRLFLASYLVTCWWLLIVVNRLLPRFLTGLVFSQSHRLPTVFAGPVRSLERLRSWIDRQHHVGIKLEGIVSDDPAAKGVTLAGPCLGGMSDLARVIEERSIGQVVLLEIPADPAETRLIVEACQSAGARLLIYQDYWDRLPIPMAPLLENEHLFLTVHAEPLEDPLNRGIKRIFDIVVSLPVVLFLLPPLSVLVWMSQRSQAPGPLLFRRTRGGQRRREFMMLKYRSMYAKPPDEKSEARQARRDDPRIYPFGAFLRKTSLDEFPQFWNVLMGDMSIVGPRPHLPQHDEEFSLLAKTYRTRQLVKPGITGLAQVSGFRGEIADAAMLQQRVRLDIQYITGWSVWLDIEITFRTLLHVFFPPKSAV